MLLPDQDRYTERHYLRDAFRAWGAYWKNQHQIYFAGSMKKNPKVSAWEEWRPIVYFFLVVAILIGIAWMVSLHQHYQIMPTPQPKNLPKFRNVP